MASQPPETPWPPVAPAARPSDTAVLAALAAAPVSRVLVMTATVVIRDNGSLGVTGRGRQQWAPLDTDHAVRIVVREGTPPDVVAAALDNFRFEFREHWPLLVGLTPAPVPPESNARPAGGGPRGPAEPGVGKDVPERGGE